MTSTGNPETEPLAEISVAGSATERGRQYGLATQRQIQDFLGEGVARIAWVLGRPVGRSGLSEIIRAHGAMVERHLPDIAEEIHGLADGAGISIDDAYLLQCRREAMHSLSRKTTQAVSGGCTAIALGNGSRCIAQTVDLPGRLAEHALVLRSHVEQRTILQLTFTGLLGYIGINDAGLAVGLNMVLGGDWRPAIPPYLLVRRLLELDSVAECVEELHRLPRAAPRCYTFVDNRSACQVETTCDELAVIEGVQLVHTNHYIDPGMVAHERSHIVQRRESRHRYDRARHEFASRWTHETDRDRQAANLFEILSSHGDAPICLHGGDDPQRAATVAAVVLQNPERRMLARRGNCCCSATQVFEIPGGLI
jgi:isopenicillin-N N-acyltransferase like protein